MALDASLSASLFHKTQRCFPGVFKLLQVNLHSLRLLFWDAGMKCTSVHVVEEMPHRGISITIRFQT